MIPWLSSVVAWIIVIWPIANLSDPCQVIYHRTTQQLCFCQITSFRDGLAKWNISLGALLGGLAQRDSIKAQAYEHYVPKQVPTKFTRLPNNNR
jgi:hypothetical protein